MNIITKFTDGINRDTLTRAGLLTIAGNELRLPPDIVEKAFLEADAAVSLPDDTQYGSGGISSYFEYRGKNFLGTSLLNRMFSMYIPNQNNQSNQIFLNNDELYYQPKKKPRSKVKPLICMLIIFILGYLAWKYFQNR